MTEDLILAGFDAYNLPLEIGCRGVRNNANHEKKTDDMISHLQLYLKTLTMYELGKVESGGGPIFKVVLEC